jgi:hypothetical protein
MHPPNIHLVTLEEGGEEHPLTEEEGVISRETRKDPVKRRHRKTRISLVSIVEKEGTTQETARALRDAITVKD